MTECFHPVPWIPSFRLTLSGFLQCFDTVGWVMWSVKIVPDMTYNVFGGTLNLAQSINSGVLAVILTLCHLHWFFDEWMNEFMFSKLNDISVSLHASVNSLTDILCLSDLLNWEQFLTVNKAVCSLKFCENYVRQKNPGLMVCMGTNRCWSWWPVFPAMFPIRWFIVTCGFGSCSICCVCLLMIQK